jgi:hypothetical protein
LTRLEYNFSSLFETTRIHAIVLTHNRPDTLQRCIANAIAPLNEQDILTIIDDSVPSTFSANSDFLTTTSKSSSVKLVHISPVRVKQVLADLVAPLGCHWLEKTARRDISPLRNMSLLFSIAASAETTILVDDDIIGFDLLSTHKRIGELARHGGIIAGVEIGGISELDTVTRLGGAFRKIVKAPVSRTWNIKELFSVKECLGASNHRVEYVSAGYLAFRFPPTELFAFPPGYNEDWLWCLLQAANSQIEITNLGERVIHDPPSILKPTRDDLLFELAGDLVFECLEEQVRVVDLDPESSLRRLSARIPNLAFRPSTRVQQLLLLIESSTNGHNSHAPLEELGLSIMRDLLRTGELDLDESHLLTKWCHDALQKHQAFGQTLRNREAMVAVYELLQKGRI